MFRDQALLMPGLICQTRHALATQWIIKPHSGGVYNREYKND